MSEPIPPRSLNRRASPISILRSSVDSRQAECQADKVICERCSGEMYRMHAVWRCTNCGFKTDCCGW